MSQHRIDMGYGLADASSPPNRVPAVPQLPSPQRSRWTLRKERKPAVTPPSTVTSAFCPLWDFLWNLKFPFHSDPSSNIAP